MLKKKFIAGIIAAAAFVTTAGTNIQLVAAQKRTANFKVRIENISSPDGNSPNDLVYRSDGTLFFTDANFGLPKFGDDPRKELPHTGVYSVYKGKLQLVTKEFTGPNGIALSPDEKYLYIGNWDDNRKVVYRYELFLSHVTFMFPICCQSLNSNGTVRHSSH